MRPNILGTISEYALPLVLAVVAAIAAYYFSRYADITVSISATVTAALITYLVGDKIFITSRLKEIEHTVRTEFESTVQYRRLGSVSDGLAYVAENASSCSLIRNTRLETSTSVSSSGVGRTKILDQDIAIINAIKAGTNYTLIYEKGRSEDVQGYIRAFGGKDRNRKAGAVVLYEVQTGDAPLPQMTILDYKDGTREVLVGWAMGNFRLHDAAIFLVRGRDGSGATELFSYIFENYQRIGTANAL